jgi:predicted Zn-dependent protease
VPDDELLAVSEQQYREFLRQHQVISSGEQAQLVKRVGNRIRGAVERYFREQGKADELRGYFIFMAMAGYNPNEAVEFWQRMSAQQNRASPPAFLSTHPSDESRIRNIQAHLPEAMKYYRRS